MEILKVKIADLAVLRGSGFLITVGLGSCVGIALYDKISSVAGLAHVLLSDSRLFSGRKDREQNPAKFVDTAVPLLIEKMLMQGAKKEKIIAKIAGGSELFNFNNDKIKIGIKNVEMVREILKKHSVPLIAEDVGGNFGRTMKVDVGTGDVYVKTVGREERVL